MNSNKSITSVDEYIAAHEPNVQGILQKIRMTIRKVAPDATESISYGMPAYKYNNAPLVYFAAFKKHIGFYATPQAHEEFADRLAQYKQGKGSVQFPFDHEIPYKLIADMTAFKLAVIKSQVR